MTITEEPTTYLSPEGKEAFLRLASTVPGRPVYLVQLPTIVWHTQEPEEVPDLVRLALRLCPGVTIQVETLENLRRGS